MNSRSRRALSPVVASIILIAVTVAVSLAVGGYMFGLFDVFKGENIKVSNVNFISGSPKSVNMTFANLGTALVSIKYIQMNNGNSSGWIQVWTASGTNGDVQGNSQLQTAISYVWTAGTAYEFRAVTAKGTTLSQSQVAS